MFKYLIVLALVSSVWMKSISDSCINEVNCDEDTNGSLITMLSDLQHYKPVEFAPGLSLQVERTPTSLNSKRVEGRMFSFLSQHALNLDMGAFSLRLSRSDEDSDQLELAVFLPNGKNGKGRGKKSKIMLPMLIGFKAATAIAIGIVAISVLTFKAMVAAKLALIVTAAMALKKMMEGAGGGGSAAIHEAPQQQVAQPYLPYNVDIPDATAYHGATGFDAYGYGLGGQEAAASDLSAQYSSAQGMIEVAGPNNTAAAVTAAKRRDNLMRRRPYVAKQHPVYNYRKVPRP